LVVAYGLFGKKSINHLIQLASNLFDIFPK